MGLGLISQDTEQTFPNKQSIKACPLTLWLENQWEPSTLLGLQGVQFDVFWRHGKKSKDIDQRTRSMARVV